MAWSMVVAAQPARLFHLEGNLCKAGSPLASWCRGQQDCRRLVGFSSQCKGLFWLSCRAVQSYTALGKHLASLLYDFCSRFWIPYVVLFYFANFIF